MPVPSGTRRAYSPPTEQREHPAVTNRLFLYFFRRRCFGRSLDDQLGVAHRKHLVRDISYHTKWCGGVVHVNMLLNATNILHYLKLRTRP
jgi:hypothetical protein